MADEKYYTLSEEAINRLCGLIRESHSVAEGIDDENIATNSTYSSAKLQELLGDAGVQAVELTKEEYDTLSEEEKNSDIIYFIINKNYIMYRNIVYGEDKNDYNVINNTPIYLNSESAVEVNSNYKTFFDTLGEKNYTLLENKPQINNVELGGNKSSADLGLASTGDIETIQTELDTNIGYSLGLSVDPLTYVMTVDLKNSTGEVISTQNVDLPIESMIISASYANKKLTLNLQSGETLDVDISDIVAGLVNEDFTIAGINMKDNITATELKTALDIDDIESDIATLKATDESTATEIASVKSDVAINRTTLGVQCKNLYKPAVTENMIFGAVNYSLLNGKITLSGTPSWNGGVTLCEREIIADKDLFISGWETLENISYIVQLYNPITGNTAYEPIAQTGRKVQAGLVIKQIYVQRTASHSGEVNASIIPMIRYADITDDTYEPYQPSLQEQVTALTERIVALETALASLQEA